MSTLESFSREELIAELLARPTFRGMIVYQKADFKPGLPDDAWRWESRRCDPIKVWEQIGPAIAEEGFSMDGPVEA